VSRIEKIRQRRERVNLPTAFTATEDAAKLWSEDLPWLLDHVDVLGHETNRLLKRVGELEAENESLRERAKYLCAAADEVSQDGYIQFAIENMREALG
jgi:hypothetical protein